MIKFIKNFLSSIRPMTEIERRDLYLSEAYDLIDLERRMKEFEKNGSRYSF